MTRYSPQTSFNTIEWCKQDIVNRQEKLDKAIQDRKIMRRLDYLDRMEKRHKEEWQRFLELSENDEKWSERQQNKANAINETRFERIDNEIARIKEYYIEENKNDEKSENANDGKKEVDIRLLQAFSYTVFDTILFAITRGNAPDFTLISQSALFDAVYTNISRGYDSYLFKEVPPSAVAAIYQGRSILEELRQKEDRFLDEHDLWDVYAPEIQQWWLNVALPLIFCDRDEEWDKLSLPTYEEMQLWNDGELSQRQHFPAVADLVELAKSKAVEVSDNFNFKILLNV